MGLETSHYLGCAMIKCVFRHMQTGKPRSDFASVQSDQGLHCLLAESLDTTECMNGEQRPELYEAHVQDDLNLCILGMLEGTFFA